jgi:hypothetical protein
MNPADSPRRATASRLSVLSKRGGTVMKSAFAIALVLAMALATPAGAKENYHEKQINAETKEKFVDVMQSTQREMSPGGKYEFVQPKERVQIDQSFGEMTKLFDEYGTVSAMTQDAKVKLFNDQEIVNSILTKRDRDRVICTNQAPIGSHIPITQCHTYAQEVEAREGTKKQLDEWKRAPCVATWNGKGPPPPQCHTGGGGN